MKTLVLGVIFTVLSLGVNGNYDNNDIAEMKAKMDAMERRLSLVEQQQSKRLKCDAMTRFLLLWSPTMLAFLHCLKLKIKVDTVVGHISFEFD